MNLCPKEKFKPPLAVLLQGFCVNHVHRKISSEVNCGFYFALEHTANDLPSAVALINEQTSLTCFAELLDDSGVLHIAYLDMMRRV
jgi:hypothetical protein